MQLTGVGAKVGARVGAFHKIMAVSEYTIIDVLLRMCANKHVLHDIGLGCFHASCFKYQGSVSMKQFGHCKRTCEGLDMGTHVHVSFFNMQVTGVLSHSSMLAPQHHQRSCTFTCAYVHTYTMIRTLARGGARAI